MDNEKRSYQEIINNHQAHTLLDCLECLKGGYIQDSLKSDLLIDSLRGLVLYKHVKARDTLNYIIDSAINDDFIHEEVGSHESTQFLNWDINYVKVQHGYEE